MTLYKVSPAIKPLNQKYSTTCWLTCLEMMVQWKIDKGQKIISKGDICRLIDEKTDYWSETLAQTGIAPYEGAQVARALGMQPTGVGDYTLEIIHDILTKKGPIYMGGFWNGSAHAILITGCDKETGDLWIADPWENFTLIEIPRSLYWINARGKYWKSYEGSVMYWK